MRYAVNVTASFDRYRFRVKFTLDLNALRELRDLDASYDEVVRPYLDADHRGDGENNWLHPDQVDEAIHDTVVRRLWQMLLPLQLQLYDIASALRQNPLVVAQAAPLTVFDQVEIASDLACSDPHSFLRRIAPHFKREFNYAKTIRYGSTARGYTDLQSDGNLIYGFRVQFDKYKGYEKTDRRLRLERTAMGSACSTCAQGRDLGSEHGFRDFFRALAEDAAERFNAVRRYENPLHHEHSSLAELLSLINPILRRHQPREVERVYNALMRHGRLTTDVLSSAALSRLAGRDVLVNSETGSGRYHIHPRFALAVRVLRAADGRWQGQ